MGPGPRLAVMCAVGESGTSGAALLRRASHRAGRRRARAPKIFRVDGRALLLLKPRCTRTDSRSSIVRVSCRVFVSSRSALASSGMPPPLSRSKRGPVMLEHQREQRQKRRDMTNESRATDLHVHSNTASSALDPTGSQTGHRLLLAPVPLKDGRPYGKESGSEKMRWSQREWRCR